MLKRPKNWGLNILEFEVFYDIKATGFVALEN